MDALLDDDDDDDDVTKNQIIVNYRWRTAVILKIVFWLYVRDLLAD